VHPLLNSLNLDYPGLEPVKKAVEDRDVSQALAELVRYFRARPEPDTALLAQADSAAAARADAALRHDFLFYNEPGHVPGEPFDWTYRPGIDWEWTWALNRHGWWQDLSSAYLASGNEMYMRELDMLIRTWVGGHLPTVEDASAWRTIEAGIRSMGPWPGILGALKASTAITRDACGLLFPEFKRAAGWVSAAVQKFETEILHQTHPDGAQEEYSSHYHFVCLHNFEMRWTEWSAPRPAAGWPRAFRPPTARG
jgi:hypothetical protein